MYTGASKKAVVIKTAKNSIFEEAYFILKDNANLTVESEMIKEANTIIDENFGNSTQSFLYNKRWYFFTFFVGFALSFLICAIIGFF